MKKILLTGLMIIMAVPAMAQMYGNNSAVSKGTISQAGTPKAGLFPELKSEVAQPQKKEENSDSIKLIIDNVKIMTPPMGNNSVCYGTLTVKNDTKTMIRSMKLTATYGSLDNPLSYGEIMPNGGLGIQLLAFGGENCKYLLEIPTIRVTSCEGTGLSAGICQSKIEYIPLKR
ncbi:MAG: hypothetical protein IKY98_00925 [Alphaproteobacteria bacterium]|nr:hypothetical protein [Alphaproteobacteria bacterium]